MSEPQLVEVYRARDSLQAHLIQAALEDAGIRARVGGEIPHGAVAPGWSTAPQILVLEPDAERARAVIQEIDAPRAPSA